MAPLAVVVAVDGQMAPLPALSSKAAVVIAANDAHHCGKGRKYCDDDDDARFQVLKRSIKTWSTMNLQV